LVIVYWVFETFSVSEMTYTVSSGTLNSTIPYHFETFETKGITFSKWCEVRQR